jgi:hypothetical protein
MTHSGYGPAGARPWTCPLHHARGRIPVRPKDMSVGVSVLSSVLSVDGFRGQLDAPGAQEPPQLGAGAGALVMLCTCHDSSLTQS